MLGTLGRHASPGRWRWPPATGTCSSWSTTTRRCGCSTVAGAWPIWRCCDEAEVRAVRGTGRRRYADFAVLRGDPSDGLPGVPGVGREDRSPPAHPIRRPVRDHGRADRPGHGFAPGTRRKLQEATDYLAVAPQVVRVARDVPLPELPAPPPRPPRPTRSSSSSSPRPGAWPAPAGGGRRPGAARLTSTTGHGPAGPADRCGSGAAGVSRPSTPRWIRSMAERAVCRTAPATLRPHRPPAPSRSSSCRAQRTKSPAGSSPSSASTLASTRASDSPRAHR